MDEYTPSSSDESIDSSHEIQAVRHEYMSSCAKVKTWMASNFGDSSISDCISYDGSPNRSTAKPCGSFHAQYNNKDIDNIFGRIEVKIINKDTSSLAACINDVDASYTWSHMYVEAILKILARFFSMSRKEEHDLLLFWRRKEMKSSSIGAQFLNCNIPQMKHSETLLDSYTPLPGSPEETPRDTRDRLRLETLLAELQEMKSEVYCQYLNPRHGHKTSEQKEKKIQDRFMTLLWKMLDTWYEVELRLAGFNEMTYYSHWGRQPVHTTPDLVLRDDREHHCVTFEICGSMLEKPAESSLPYEVSVHPCTSTPESSCGGASKDTELDPKTQSANISTPAEGCTDEMPSRDDGLHQECDKIFLSSENSRKLPSVLDTLNLSDHQKQHIKRKLYDHMIYNLMGALAIANKDAKNVSQVQTTALGFFIFHEIAIPVKLQCPLAYAAHFLSLEHDGLSDVEINLKTETVTPVYTVLDWHLDLSTQLCRRSLVCLLKQKQKKLKYQTDESNTF